jgi:hypothetical protein
VRRIVVLLAIGGAIAGLAATTGGRQQHHASASRDTHDVLPVAVNNGPNAGTDLIFTWSSPHGSRLTLARSLRAFTKPRKHTAVAPETIAFPATPAFTPEPDRAQLLLSSGAARIVAYPTKQGDVCFFLEGVSGSCSSALGDGALPMVERGQVWGLIDNEAVAVNVLVRASGLLNAAIGRNAFYLRLPKPVQAPNEIVVQERDGVRHIYTIRACHIGPLTPLTASAPLPPPC